jgi:hypothetical protein
MWLADAPGFWPLQRNLIISCSAGLALLISLLIMRLRFRQYVRGRSLEAELEVARGVQRSLLPGGSERLRNVSVAAEFLPAAEVGGDLYDVFESADGVTALVAGDVSGKGVPAALLMGVIHGAVRSSNWLEANARPAPAMPLCSGARTTGARSSYDTLTPGTAHRCSSDPGAIR